jgi:sugar fermentation stimulation protein A
MIYPKLISARILNRYKRFFADVELDSGEKVTAHVANTGSMKTCWSPGDKVYLSHSDDPKRKLAYSLELIQTNHHFIMINTSKTNHLAQQALTSGLIPELKNFDVIEPEQKTLNSRFDFKLTQSHGMDICWVEVKNVTLLKSPQVATFPDAITTRGAKHLDELMLLKQQGFRVAMLYVVSRTDALTFDLQQDIDLHYAQKVKQAHCVGVEIYAYQIKVDLPQIMLTHPLPILGLYS